MQARRTAAIIESAKILGIKQFKQKQVAAIESFLSGKDTFVSLPTGYGKCYLCCSTSSVGHFERQVVAVNKIIPECLQCSQHMQENAAKIFELCLFLFV